MKCGECVIACTKFVSPNQDCTCNEARVARLKEQLGPEWVVVSRELWERVQHGCSCCYQWRYVCDGCNDCQDRDECEEASCDSKP